MDKREIYTETATSANDTPQPVKRGRGRPPGSKNKPKTANARSTTAQKRPVKASSSQNKPRKAKSRENVRLKDKNGSTGLVRVNKDGSEDKRRYNYPPYILKGREKPVDLPPSKYSPPDDLVFTSVLPGGEVPKEEQIPLVADVETINQFKTHNLSMADLRELENAIVTALFEICAENEWDINEVSPSAWTYAMREIGRMIFEPRPELLRCYTNSTPAEWPYTPINVNNLFAVYEIYRDLCFRYSQIIYQNDFRSFLSVDFSLVDWAYPEEFQEGDDTPKKSPLEPPY